MRWVEEVEQRLSKIERAIGMSQHADSVDIRQAKLANRLSNIESELTRLFCSRPYSCSPVEALDNLGYRIQKLEEKLL